MTETPVQALIRYTAPPVPQIYEFGSWSEEYMLDLERQKIISLLHSRRSQLEKASRPRTVLDCFNDVFKAEKDCILEYKKFLDVIQQCHEQLILIQTNRSLQTSRNKVQSVLGVILGVGAVLSGFIGLCIWLMHQFSMIEK